MILNADRGKLSGIEVTTRIKQNYPSVSVILITDNENEGHIFSAMKCGANACVTKEITPDELISTVRRVARGTYPISEALFRPEITSRVVGEFEVFSLINKKTGNLNKLATPSVHDSVSDTNLS